MNDMLRLRALVGAGTLAAAMAVHVQPARACGGFFCSQSAPVEQTAEEIIFSQNDDGTVTAVISIQYQGPSEKFAWVLPVAGEPVVDISSQVAFDALRSASDPVYQITTRIEGQCKVDPNNSPAGPGSASGGTGGGSQDAGLAFDDGITVVAQGTVGPYVHVTIAVDPTLDSPEQAAVDWLTQNGYDVTNLGPEVLHPYLADGLNLLAFKLQKGPNVTSGSIRPVVVTYKGSNPSIPIRPTAVAASDDMGVRVWVLSGAQAVPINYKSLVLNEALIDWLSYGQNYRAVVTAAADEAGGQGFVTEMGAPTTQLAEVVFPSYQEQQWLSYSRQTFASGFDTIQQASFTYRGWDGWREAVCDAVTLPNGVTCDEFGRMPNDFLQTADIDQTKFLRSLYENVVRPVMRARDLIAAHAYITRLFTTMSAADMTLDPAFDFNPDLADVSNVHTAEQVIECTKSLTEYDAPWRLVLPQGGVIRSEDYDSQGNGPFGLDAGLPSNLLIVQLGTSGPGEVLEDNSVAIQKMLSKLSAGKPAAPTTPPAMQNPSGLVPIGGSANPAGNPVTPGSMTLDGGVDSPQANAKSDDCAVAQPGSTRSDAPAPLGLGLLVAALAFLRRRRR